MTSQRLAPNETLPLEPCQCIESGCNQENHGSGDQARRSWFHEKTEPLYETHDAINSPPHVVGLKASNESVELFRGWADSKEERDFKEDDDEGRASVGTWSLADCSQFVTLKLCIFHNVRRQQGIKVKNCTYRQMMLNMMTREGMWKMFAMPSAKQRNMHNMPVLQ